MNATVATFANTACAPPFSLRYPRGMTLLEVLVALGILVAGLASIAALMPAAGARLAEATAIDRAGTLAANAHADLKNRGMLTSSTCFPSDTEITGSTGRICVFGAAFPTGSEEIGSGTYPIRSGTLTSGTFYRPTVSPTFSMTLQDNIQLSATNSLATDPIGISYSVTVVPTSTGTIAAGSPVRVGVVVFKRPDATPAELNLSHIGPGVFEINASPSADQNESTRKQFLPACSWVFAARGGASLQSRWFHIGSSWTTQRLSADRVVPDRSFIVLSDTNADSLVVSGSLTVQAFPHILTVDERPAILK